MRLGNRSRWAALGVAGIVLAACSGSTPAASSSSAAAASTALPSQAPGSSSLAPSAEPSPSPIPSKGPATAQFTLTGTNGLTGPVTTDRIVCGQPSLGGPQITFQGQSGTTGPMVVVFIESGHVEVRVATGSAATLKLRSFVGSGVTGFDASTGATLSAPLTESTPPGSAIGSLGSLSAIDGTVACGDQQAGTANVVVSGVSPFGSLSAALTDVKVTCTVTPASGTFVGVVGLGMAGATPVLVFVTASTGLLQVAVETTSTGSFYTGKGADLTTLVPGGASMAGDVTEGVKAGATPHILHVTGSATCGTTIQQ